MYFLQQLTKFCLPKMMMVHFYTAIIKSIPTFSITIWYAAAIARDKGRLHCIICSTEKVIGCNLPSRQDLLASNTLRRAGKTVVDPAHPGHNFLRASPLAGGCGPTSLNNKAHDPI